MVLEEEIYFLSQDVARDFVKLMKEMGVSSQIRQKAHLDIRLMLSGRYTNLIAMLDGIAGEEDISITEREVCLETRDHLTSQRDLLDRTFEKFQVGDRIGSALFDIASGDRTLDGDENEDEINGIIEEISLTRLLQLNDLLEVQESGITLIKKIEPDQALLSLFADEIPLVDNAALEKHDIRSTITAGDDEEWLVAIGPDFIFLDDLSRVEEFLDEYETGEEENMAFFTRVEIKQILVSEILGMIKAKGNASREDIINEFSERDIETKEEGSNIALHLSGSYIDAVLDDLKKTGIIRGKDQKLRIAA